ncbi:hypothetical protein ACNKHW_05790 [Shigella flexneri]
MLSRYWQQVQATLLSGKSHHGSNTIIVAINSASEWKSGTRIGIAL